MKCLTSLPALAAACAMMLGAAGTAAALQLRSAQGGQVRALLVGINDYTSITRLDGALADMEDIHQALLKAGISEDKIKRLPNEKATRAAFVDGMEKLLADSAPGDLAIITFAGHGMRVPAPDAWKKYEPDGQSEEFVLANYQTAGPGTKEGVMNKEMKAWLSRLDAKGVDVIFVADTCHGGGLARSVNPMAAPLTLRETRAVPKPGESQLVPIAMSEKEKASTVEDMPHVSFLAGAKRENVVPEWVMPNQPTRRGALSFAFARAIENSVDAGASPVNTRGTLFQYALQKVSETSKGQQVIDLLPRASNARAVQLFRTTDAPGQSPSVAVGQPAAAIRIFVVNGTAATLAGVKPIAAFLATASKAEADLIYDAASGNIINNQGDTVAEHVTAANLGGTIDRTFALNGIDKLSLKTALTISLRAGGKLYTPQDTPVIEASGLANQFLVVFNIASDGQLQMLTPALSSSGKVGSDSWSYQPSVRGPFGEDHVVGVASPVAIPDLVEWLWSHNEQPVAALVPKKLAEIMAATPGARIGSVGLFTSP